MRLQPPVPTLQPFSRATVQVAAPQTFGRTAQQKQLLAKPGFFAAPYAAKYGWTRRDAEGKLNLKEIAKLLVDSYRLVALKRMITELDG